MRPLDPGLVLTSVYDPRASESKVTRKKLLMSLAGYDQELALPRPPERQENKVGVGLELARLIWSISFG